MCNSRGVGLCISIAILCLLSLCTSEPPTPLEQLGQCPPRCTKRLRDQQPLICLVVRTYRGHGDQDFPYLEELLHSIKSQTSSQWETLIIVADGNPFKQLPILLGDLADDRIWVYAEHIGDQYKARDGSSWTPNYHALLYNLTDEAIRVCPPSTQWVLATNGDNLYAKDAFQAILDAPEDADVVALDYYSRYQRSTGPPCMRFAASSKAPPCKENRMKWCHTDLGAMAFRRQRLLEEGVRFGAQAGSAAGPDHEHADGLLAASIIEAGWRLHHIARRCLYDHSPSPQRCARMGGVWDDSGPVVLHSGGRCITEAQAQQRYDAALGAIYMDIVQLSHDGGLAGFGEQGAQTAIRCLRMADAAAQQNMSALYFGDACTAPQDMQAMQPLLQSEGLALAQSMLAEAQAAQQLLQASSAPQVQAQHFRRPPKPPDWEPGARPAQYRKRMHL